MSPTEPSPGRRVLLPVATRKFPRSAAPMRELSVALTTEGTYPFHDGGVSVWCDQLVHGLMPHRFDVHAVVATGSEQITFDLPANVRAVHRIALWGDERTGDSLRSWGRRRRTGANHRALVDAVKELVLDIATDGDRATFLPSLRSIQQTSDRSSLAAVLLSDELVDHTVSALALMVPAARLVTALERPAVTDAVRVLGLLEHLLRPLHLATEHVDLVHASGNGIGALAALAISWRCDAPLLLSEHGVYLRERYIEYHPTSLPSLRRTFLLRFHRQLCRTVYQCADAIAPGSEYNRRWELANGAELHKISPIHNGVNADDFDHDVPEPDVPTIVWVGRIDPLKDLKSMLTAFARVRASVPGVRLRIFGGVPAGNEWYQAECVQLHADLALDDSAVFEGRIASIADAYSCGTLVVATSISEGFPYAVIEAMASGRAMIATDVGGVREAVAGHGVLVPPQDPDSLADACISLLADTDRRRRFAASGRARVRTEFQLDRCVERHRELYDDLAGGAQVAGSTSRSVPARPVGRAVERTFVGAGR